VSIVNYYLVVLAANSPRFATSLSTPGISSSSFNVSFAA
jgi:hypothetical protein